MDYKIKRSAMLSLDSWAKQTDRKPLLIRGARQVGKTWIVKEWCHRNRLELVTVNLEEQPRFAALFEKDLDVDRIIDELTASFGISLRSSNTVLFFDEIQKAPKAIGALRYFYEKAPDIKVIAAGSLVEFVLEEVGLPVGRVESLFLFPLTFVEFLEALNKPGLVNLITEFSIDNTKPLLALAHEELLSLLKLYYRIGGMPKVLSVYLASKDMVKVSQEQSLLINGYIDDFRKYAKKADWTLLETIFHKMGDIAGSSPIRYSAIESQTHSSQIRRALLALQHALIIHKILPVHTDKLPLAAHAIDKRFKASFLDIGLLHYLIGFDWGAISPDADLTDVANGRFAEQFVAQEIIATRSIRSRYAPHYWERAAIGSQAEVDFVVEARNSAAPIEVKSGGKGSLKSLNMYIKEFSPTRAYVFSQQNVKADGILHFLPLYLACRL